MIDDATKEIVRKRANYLCEYCHFPERISTTRFTVDHLIPKSIGGSDELNN
ncbi:HNH endonuclease [Nostoc sp.]|uniref:HNH endonuclease n=1 Tax=Nostoc sp. TaxID=1180 RepID=UPI002FFC4E50